MGCSAQDQIAGYKAVNKKLTELNPKVNPIKRQIAINKYWLNLENNIMTLKEKEIYSLLVAQTDGVISINHNDSKQTNVPLVFVKEIGNELVVYLENGQNYTFEKGSIKSKPTKAGRTVFVPTMELAKYAMGIPLGVAAVSALTGSTNAALLGIIIYLIGTVLTRDSK